MAYANRKPLRKKLASLLVTPLTGTATVKDFSPSDVKGLTPVVIVKSVGSERLKSDRYRGQSGRLFFEIHALVNYGKTNEAWTPALAQDLLDDIEKIIADTVNDNSGNAEDATEASRWTLLQLQQSSAIDVLQIEGVDYLHEVMFASIDVDVSE